MTRPKSSSSVGVSMQTTSRLLRLSVLLALVGLSSCLLASCKKASPIARERHWFDLAFDSTYNSILQASENGGVAGQNDRIGAQMAQELKEEARDQKELARLGRAVLAGIGAIQTEYDESGASQYMELFKEQRRLCAQYPMMFPYEDGEKLLAEATARTKGFIQNLREHREEIREKGWNQYLVDRKFSQ